MRVLELVRLAGTAAALALAAAVAPALSQTPQAAPDTAAAALPDSSAWSAVVFRRDTLVVIRERLGAFSAEDRAAAITERLRRLASGPRDTIVVVPGETADELMVGDRVLMIVTDADARAAGRARSELSVEYALALTAPLRRSSLLAIARTIALGALWTLLATAVLVLALRVMGNLFPRLMARVESWRGTVIPSVRIQRLELLSADRATDALLGALRILRVAVIVLLLYFYVPLVLSFFPWTRPLSESILGYVTTPLARMWDAFIAYLPNVFFIAVIVLVTYYVLKLIHLVFNAIERGTVSLASFDAEWAQPTYKIVRFLVLAFAVVVLFPYLPGSKSDAFKGVSLFLGILFSLGSSSAIANVVAGVVLTYTRAFNVGDRVKIGDTVGDVVTKTLLVTRIRTIKNVDITIPNGMVLSTHVLNYSAMARTTGVILHTGVTIGYDAPWRQVHELLLSAARATPDILAQPEPFVLQTSLDDFYVAYQINAYTDKPESMARTYSALHANIQDKFNEGGVEILSPHYRSQRDGNQVTIPANYLPSTYEAPAFRVQRVGGGDGGGRP